jgi:hypothetical protein
MRRPGLLVALIVAVGLAGTAVALGSREGDPRFAAGQQGLMPVRAGALERLILTTSDPRPARGGHARKVSCVSGTASALGDPWTCVVRYPRLPRVRYRVTVYADRSIYGTGRAEGPAVGAGLTVRGCCVGPS